MPPSAQRTRPHRGRRTARRRRIAVAWAIAVAGGSVAAVLADAEPTGVDVADRAYGALYVLGVALACSFARRWTWPVLAGAAMVAGPDLPWAVVGGAGLALAAAAQLDRRRRQPVGALVGVLSALALLHLGALVAFGVPSLVAALAPVPAVMSALARLRSRVRRPVLVAAGAVSGLAVAVLVVFGVGVLLLRADADRGVTAARAGLESLRAGEQEPAARSFASAADAFDAANGVATAWWMSPGRVVPALAQHLEVARILTEEGGELATVSARTAPAVSLDDLTAGDGSFRLDRITEIEPLAADVVAALRSGQRRLAALSTDWLTGPMVGAVVGIQEEIESSLPDAELAVDALELAPTLLGGEGEKRYVVLFGNPAEARAMGGFVASIGTLTADAGRLEFTSLPTPGELTRELQALRLPLTSELSPAFANSSPELFVENWSDSPDIATVVDVVAELYPALAEGAPVDGVLYADPYVLAALLELAGPVTIPETGELLTSKTAVGFLLRDQYLSEEFEPGGERKERLGAAGEIAFDQLLDGALPRPRVLATTLSPLVQARRLLFSTTDPAVHDLLERVGLRPPLDTGRDETVLVAQGNRGANKLDAYLERAVAYEAEVGEDGGVAATITVDLTNNTPVSRLVPYQTGSPRSGDALGTNVLNLDVYSALDETAVLIDGDPADYSDNPAYSLNEYSIPVSVAPGATVSVEVRLTGFVDPRSCSLAFLPYAAASTDTLSVRVSHPGGTVAVDDEELAKPLTFGCSWL